jgi:hypothetical protein
MCDKLVYDLAQEVEGSPSVFIRKDWINILDNQNQSYVSNQSVLDTSQLSNSNKWMSYREAYFLVPMTLTMATTQDASFTNGATPTLLTPYTDTAFSPATSDKSADYSIGLKNWFGNIIHSFTLDYNGTTIIQQTPFVNMWNSFKLMTSLSYGDIMTQGCTIGFYPDQAETFEFYPSVLATTGALAGTTSPAWVPGCGTCLNSDELRRTSSYLVSKFNSLQSGLGNRGFYERQKWIAFDPQAVAGNDDTVEAGKYDSLLQNVSDANGQNATMNQLYKGYVMNKVNQVLTNPTTQTTPGVLQYSITATIYLKHIHSFFNMIPLLKGAFMKMTMNLNNVSCTVLTGGSYTAAGGGAGYFSQFYQSCSSVQSALGGVNMIMVASQAPQVVAPSAAGVAQIDYTCCNGAYGLNSVSGLTATAAGAVCSIKPYRINLSVGGTCLDSQITGTRSISLQTNAIRSVYLYIPAYTFNPTFEQAYLSSPVKQIKYTDIYQYQVLSVAKGGNINNLLTNGIANVKSVLVIPFFSANSQSDSITTDATRGSVSLSANTGFSSGIPVYQSPFDSAGCGTTSPLAHITNFNIQVSGQNAIYNLQRYNFEQFNNQLYGQNAVNGGLTDGITSSLIDRQSFDLAYCYYYVNIERMLPVEQSVPKSIQLIGQNVSGKTMDYICFIEYGTEVSIDSLTGARV